MNIELGPHERLDDLVLDGMKVIQRDDQFCFSLDTVLLAHFGAVPHGPALDLGTGTAAIPLILTARGAKALTAVEFNPVMPAVTSPSMAGTTALPSSKATTAASGSGRRAALLPQSTPTRRTGKRAAVPIATSTASAGPAMKRRRPLATSSML